MDRDTLISAIDQGPVRVHMNDGTSFEISDHKSCAVDDMTAYVLYRDEQTQKIKAHWLSLVCMTRTERVASAAI
jgi:ribosomal protein S4E